MYGANGALLARWGAGQGAGVAGNGPGQFMHPAAVAADAAGDAYVADTGNNRIVKLSPAGAVLASGDRAAAETATSARPTASRVDAAGRVYVLDGANNRVQLFDGGGSFLGKWGCAERSLAPSPSPRRSRSTAAERCMSPTPTTTAWSALKWISRGLGLPAGELVAAAARCGAGAHLSLARSGSVLALRALALNVSCQRGCTIIASASLRARGARRAVRLIPTTRALAPGLLSHVRIRVGAAALRRLRGELGRRRGLYARVTILAIGPTGRRTTLTKTIPSRASADNEP